ncbi:hypothetical protein BBJ28_00002334 [Nothophytophthora sp. Chile5]|nr:hypothetical protein BBJ28_00002334 [Nothophytophthora sp. Chile5]
MEGGDTAAANGGASKPKARRGNGAAIYEQYLNIKHNALPSSEAAPSPQNALSTPPSAKMQEISNSTDFRDGPGSGRGSPPRGGMMGGRGPGGPRRSRSRSLPRNGGPPGGPMAPRSPPRYGNGNGNGRFDFPPDRRLGPGSPPRGGFGGRGPDGPPPFDDFGRGRGPPPMGRPNSPPRGGGGFDRRFDDRGPPPPMNGGRGSPRRDGPPMMFPPRGRSRSRSPNRPPSADMMRKRDRSWDRGGPPPDNMKRPFNGPFPDSPRMMEPRGIYPDALPHLKNAHEFLQLDRHGVQRVVYELRPQTMADTSGYHAFRDYLVQGKNNHARAGIAMEMEDQGFKVFIIPPGQVARQLGYKGDHMIAVLRSR